MCGFLRFPEAGMLTTSHGSSSRHSLHRCKEDTNVSRQCQTWEYDVSLCELPQKCEDDGDSDDNDDDTDDEGYDDPH